ncbi:hypothetical protein [Pseudomonas viridiflava]|uniref:hypothetical protein n=1 Tax=Pseudomonas syringae group TaxID=136849 RepID=UPI000F01B17D|nr:hypothetical protein [Pseudomonas viridiflava]
MRYEKLTVKEVFVVVKRLYEKAMHEMGFRPEQAFAYAQDEMESLVGHERLVMGFIIQTAIYSVGLKEGLSLSKDSPYAEDMLELLADIYSGCSRAQLIDLNISSAEFEDVVSRAELVSREFLGQKW